MVAKLLTLMLVIVVGCYTQAQKMSYYQRVKCSNQCPCYYRSLFCKGYALQNLPDDLTPTIQNIDFQNNLLTEVTNDTLTAYKDLRKLLLGNNGITSVSESAFDEQRQLTALDLSDNQITQIASNTFNPLRKKLQHLSLLGNNVSKIEGLFRGMRRLQTLNLKYNSISFITAETFYQNKRLNYLHLGNNQITYISPHSFKRQHNLQYLYLDYNKLQTLTELRLSSKKLDILSISNSQLNKVPDVLSPSIKQLNLAGNNITVLESHPLSTMKQLQMLDLSRNSISSIDHRALKELREATVIFLSQNDLMEIPKKLPSSIEHLKLDHNKISHLSRSSFPKKSRLRRLTLENNMIEYIHKKAFESLSLLEQLDLSNNIINRLNTGVFRDLNRLKTLDLSNISVALIEAGAFGGLQSLDSLSLNMLGSNVKIRGPLLPSCPKLRILNMYESESVAKRIISTDVTLYHLMSVQYLNLMSNNLRQLDSTFPQYLPQLKRIQLSSNPWNCSRDLYWMSRWLTAGSIEAPHLSYLYCDSPLWLKGRQLIDLDPFDWTF